MDARAPGGPLGAEVPDGLHGRGELVLLEGHGGGEEAGHAVGGVVVRKGAEPLGLPVGEVLSHRAVGVDVHKAGDHIAPGGVQVPGAGEGSKGGDGPGELQVHFLEAPRCEYVPVFDAHDVPPLLIGCWPE